MKAYLVMPGWYVVVWKNRLDTNLISYHNAFLPARGKHHAIMQVIDMELAK